MSIDYEKGLHQELLQLQGDRLRSRAETSLIVAQYQWQEKKELFSTTLHLQRPIKHINNYYQLPAVDKMFL